MEELINGQEQEVLASRSSRFIATIIDGIIEENLENKNSKWHGGECWICQKRLNKGFTKRFYLFRTAIHPKKQIKPR